MQHQSIKEEEEDEEKLFSSLSLLISLKEETFDCWDSYGVVLCGQARAAREGRQRAEHKHFAGGERRSGDKES